MRKSLLGREVESTDLSGIHLAEVRQTIKGKYVQFCKDVSFLCDRHAEKKKIKATDPKVVLQAIFDQSVSQLFAVNNILLIPLSNGKCWEFDVSDYESVEELHEEVSKWRRDLLSREKTPDSDEEQLDLIEAAAATDAEIDELDAEAATDAELEEEDELEKLRREMEA